MLIYAHSFLYLCEMILCRIQQKFYEFPLEKKEDFIDFPEISFEPSRKISHTNTLAFTPFGKHKIFRAQFSL